MVLIENTCPLCGVFAETERHILVSCNFAWSCWEYAGLAAVNRDASSLGLWLADMFRLLNGESQGRVVIWRWIGALDKVECRYQAQRRCSHLRPLFQAWLRVCCPKRKRRFGCCFAGVKHGKVSPDLAEIMRIREPLSWLKNHAYTEAIVEIDSLVCAEAIRNAEVFVSSFGLVVEDCKKILDSLINVSLLFVKRSANCAAHFVARHSISLAERMFSINSVPMELMSILTSDCSS
uniref:RNase H type-1 domain-containing protein n=1 Tax=Cannabis sativa TaxID=3483 RepID=A0A803PRL2_CANSA